MPIEEWCRDASFNQLKDIVAALRVINDAAERSVKLGTEFSQVLTKDEGRRQDIMQSVELARRAFPFATKKCFLEVASASSVQELMGKIDYDARRDQ